MHIAAGYETWTIQVGERLSNVYHVCTGLINGCGLEDAAGTVRINLSKLRIF